MKKYLPLALVALLLSGCKSGGQSMANGGVSSDPNQTYELKLAPKAGEVYKYALNSTSATSTTEIDMTMKVDKVVGDQVTIITTFDSIKLNGSSNAAATDTFKNMKLTNTMDSHGKQIESKIEGAPPGMTAPSNNNTSFPDRPVKIGDTWKGQGKVGGKDVEATYKLAKVESVGGKAIASLEVTFSGELANTISGPMVSKIEVESGMPYSLLISAKAKAPNGADVTSTTEMRRI